jgi:hypothetical protein
MSDIKRFEDKLDKVVDDIGEIKITLSSQHVSLKEHMRRTSILEESIKPLEKHVSMVNGALKLIAVLAMIAGIVQVIVMAKR